jgi:hypothetical protein
MLRPNRRYLLDTVSIGRLASFDTVVDNFSIAIGRKAGYKQIGAYAIAIGEHAGEIVQGANAIAIGAQAGVQSQAIMAIAIGDQAGQTSQGTKAIAIGSQSGQTSQGAKAIAIGENAGQASQGANSIAIGSKAGSSGQSEFSIIISTSDTEIIATKKGLYIDPIRKFDDRVSKPSTINEGNILNYLNDTDNETKEVITGFPRLPGYPGDEEVLLAFTEAKKDLPLPILGPKDAGTMYYDTTRMRVKVYNGTAWVALADVGDLPLAVPTPVAPYR